MVPGGRQAASRVNARAAQRLSRNWSRNSGKAAKSLNLPKSRERVLTGDKKFDPYFFNLLCVSCNSKQLSENFQNFKIFVIFVDFTVLKSKGGTLGKIFDKKIESCLELNETQSKLKK